MSSWLRMLLLVSPLAACSDGLQHRADDGEAHHEDSGIADGQPYENEASVDAAGDANSATDAAPPDAAEPDAAPEMERFGSGSRLRLQGYASDGALLAVAGMFDRELQLPCRYRTAPDGHDYCMPDVAESFAHAMPGYADAACTEPLLVGRSDCAPPARYQLVTELACLPTTRVFHVEESAQQVYYSREAAGCVVHTLLPGQRLHALREELPTSALVEGKRTLQEVTKLAREVMLGSDGSWLTTGAFDLERSGCTPTWLGGGGGLRCVPSARAYLADDWFAGPACTEPVAVALKDDARCETPAVVVRSSVDMMSCQAGGLPAQLFQVGERAKGAYTHDLDASCKATPVSTAEAFSFYRTGAAFDAATLPSLELTAFGTGRVRTAAWSSSRKPLMQVQPEQGAPLLYDAQLGSTCQPIQLAGELVCAPIWALLAYGDASCSTPLLEVFESDQCAVPLPELVSVRSPRSATCGASGEHEALTLYRRGPPAETPARRFIRFQGQCVSADSPAIHARYFEVGEALPSSLLARLRFVTD